MKRSDLHQYQCEAVDYVKTHQKSFAAVDLGLGKTVIALTVIADLIASGEIKNVFIIAPLRVVYSVWRQEAALWEHTKHLTFSLIHGSNKGEIFKNTTADINIINPEGLLWVRNNKPKRLPGDMLIVDEASAFKDPSTQRFKTLKKYSKAFDRVVLMSGTPAPNSLENLWAPYYLLDSGERLFPSFSKFRNTCFRQTDYMGYTWEVKPGMKQLIYEKVADITLRLDKDDHLDMPDLVVIPTRITLDAKIRKMYDTFEKDMFLAFDDNEVSASMVPIVSLKCRQLAQGFVYTDDGETIHLHDGKIEALKELLEELDGSPALVAYTFKADAVALATAFPKAPFINGATSATEDEVTIKKWNAGELPILFAQEQAVSHGLNMQTGGDTVIWYTPTWSSERNEQLNARVFRQGQKSKRVRIFVIMAEDTIDEAVYAAVVEKLGNQKEFLNAIRDYKR